MNTHSCILCGYTKSYYLQINKIYTLFLCSYQHTTFLTPKTSKFNKAFEISMILLYYSYYIITYFC